MNCPNKEALQDFVDGELSQDESRSLVKHIQSCQSCKDQLRDIFVLQDTLNTIVQQDPCLPVETLEQYAQDSCPEEAIEDIKQHIELCARCRSFVWAFQASEEEMAQWQAQEEQAYREYLAESHGYQSAKEILTQLLPGKIELLDQTWQSLLSWVSELKTKAIESWPSLHQQPQLAGVLGFAESSDPQTEAASIILAVTLYVSEAIADGTITHSAEDIQTTINQIAPKLGAGKELQKRLLETVPDIISKSH